MDDILRVLGCGIHVATDFQALGSAWQILTDNYVSTEAFVMEG